MEELWFQQVGFHSNPFSIKPAAFHDEIVGYKVDALVQRINQGDISFVEAPLGSGKTTILKNLIKEFEGEKRVIYTSCLSSECLDIDSLLRNARLSGKLFGKLPKDMILLVDEADDLMEPDAAEILRFRESGNIVAAVFFGTKYAAQRFPHTLRKDVSRNIVKLTMLTPEQAAQLIRKRIGHLPLLSDEIIKQIYVRVNYSPRRLLEGCEDVCRTAVLSAAPKVTSTHVNEVLAPVRASVRKKKKKLKPTVVSVAKPVKKPISKPVKKIAKPKKKAMQKITIRDVEVDNFNLDNIRTYEEEMSAIKDEKEKV